MSLLLSVSAHTLPPMKLLYSFILSLTGQHSSRNRLKSTENSGDSDTDSARDDLSDLSDNEVSRSMKPAVTPTNEDEDTDELNVQLISHMVLPICTS